MNTEEPQSDDESILTHLVACDEALAAGMQPQLSRSHDTPAELQPRLQGDLAFIQVLRQVLPRRVPTPESADDLPFQQLGRFSIKRRLGQGSFGIVFLATDPNLGRDVALKVPRPEALMTGELRERFLRESRAAAGLDHPNLVPVYEAGAVGPICYIASAYCPGSTLHDWIKDRAELAPERLAATLVATLADAVGHAHARGVIHRDLKPSNVLLQGERGDPESAHSTVKEAGSGTESKGTDGDYVPRITDFGLAKFVSDASVQSGEAGAATHSGAVLGTPNYMAPEQASGKIREIGPAADLYALGAILYELLTGRPPFRGESLLDTLEQVRTREPLPPGRLRPKLSRDLETICLKCLQKEPRKRYESAAALADDLRRYLAGEPIRARPTPAWERGLKWMRRQPAVAALLGVSLLGPSVLLAVVLGFNAQLRQALAAKDGKQREADENFRLAGSAVDDFATRVSQDKRLLAHDLEGLRKELLQSALTFLHRFVEKKSEDPEVRHEQALAFKRLARLEREIGAQQKAIESLRSAVETLQKLVNEHRGVTEYQFALAGAFNDLGAAYGDMRREDLAEAAHREAGSIYQQLVQTHPDMPIYQQCLAGSIGNLGLVYEQTSRLDKAEGAYGDARNAWEKLAQTHPDDQEYKSGLAKSYFNLGMLYLKTNKLDRAEDAFRMSCNLRRALARGHPSLPNYQDDLADSLIHLGIVYEQTDRADAAVNVYFVEAGKIYQKLADDHPKIPTYRDSLARLQHSLGVANDRRRQPKLAEAAYGKAIDLRGQLVRDYPNLPDFQADLSGTQCNLALLFWKTGQQKQGRILMDEARKVQEKLVHDYPVVTKFRVSLGRTYSFLSVMDYSSRKYEAALDWLDQSVRMLETVRQQDPQQADAQRYLNQAYNERVTILNQLGRHAGALRELDRLLELSKGIRSENWLLSRADTLVRMGQYGPAMAEVDALSVKPSLPAITLYNLACICSLSSSAVRRDAQLTKVEKDQRAVQYAARAIEFLKKAEAAGFFESAARLEEMRKDKDLDALRERKDFQALIHSLHPKRTP